MAVYVHANCAMSLDGCMGLPGPKPLKLSGPDDLRRVHELRAASDAILVGVGTVLADDPKLTVKWDLLERRPGKNPTRVVLDARLRTPTKSALARPDAPTLLFHAPGAQGGPPNAQRVGVDGDDDGHLDLKQVLAELDRRKLHRLMVEGGPTVLNRFLQDNLLDELTIYVAPTIVGRADAPRLFSGLRPGPLALRLEKAAAWGPGALLRFVR